MYIAETLSGVSFVHHVSTYVSEESATRQESGVCSKLTNSLSSHNL